jgi:hypothetical protein
LIYWLLEWSLNANWFVPSTVKYVCIYICMNEHLLRCILYSIMYGFVTWLVPCFSVVFRYWILSIQLNKLLLNFLFSHDLEILFLNEIWTAVMPYSIKWHYSILFRVPKKEIPSLEPYYWGAFACLSPWTTDLHIIRYK